MLMPKISPKDPSKNSWEKLSPHSNAAVWRSTAFSQDVEGEHSNRLGYSVTVNGERHVIYSHNEAVNDPESIWDLAPRRTFQLINALLQKAGSAERMYMLNSGNDCMAWLLTSKQYRDLMETEALKERDKPVSC